MPGAEITEVNFSNHNVDDATRPDATQPAVSQTAFSLTFQNFVDLQTRLVLMPYNDSECTGAVIHSYSPPEKTATRPVSAGKDTKDDVDDVPDRVNSNGLPKDKKYDSNVDPSNGLCNETPPDAETPDENGKTVSTSRKDDQTQVGGGDGNDVSASIGSIDTNNVAVEEQFEAHVESENVEENINEEEARTDSNDIPTQQCQEKDIEDTCTLTQNNSMINEKVPSIESTQNFTRNGSANNEDPAKENDSSSSSAKENNEPMKSESKDGASESVQNNILSDDKENCTDGTKCLGDETTNHSHETVTTEFDVKDSVLIEVPGIDLSNDELMAHDFTSILNTIRSSTSPLVLKFSRIQPDQKDPSICSNISEGVDIEEESKLNNDPAAAIKGRLQRWGHQFAGEAANLSRKATDLAKEKVNEIQQQQQQQAQRESNAKAMKKEVRPEKQSEAPTIKDNVKAEPKGKGKRLEICGLFVQTSSGKCIPLKEKWQSKGDQLSGSNDKRRNNLFRKNPPKITNTSVLVIRSSVTEACPLQGYKYQWYRSKLSRKEEKKAETLDGDTWIKIDGADRVFFQPSATEVGFRIKCTITIENPPEKHLASTDNAQPLVVTCTSPCEIESDKVLFDAALKTFQPLKGDNSHVCVSSFENFAGTGDLDNAKIRLDLHTYRDSTREGYRCFFMKAFRAEGVSGYVFIFIHCMGNSELMSFFAF